MSSITRCLLVALTVLHNVFLQSVIALPSLDIKWNPSAKANDWYNFSSRVTYDEDFSDEFNDLTDNQLVALARQAYNEMAALTDFTEISGTRPGAMCALVVGHEIFFASSLTGGASRTGTNFIYNWLTDPTEANGDPQIRNSLLACQVSQVNASPGQTFNAHHRIEARCAEPMAVNQYYVAHPGVKFQGKNARVATWGKRWQTDTPDFLKACGIGGPPNQWGCYQLMLSLGIRPIQTRPKDGDLVDYPVVPKSLGQVDMCMTGHTK